VTLAQLLTSAVGRPENAGPMRMSSLLLASAILLAASGHAQAAPAWCSQTGGSLSYYGDFKGIYTEDDPRDAIYDLVVLTCYPDNQQKAEAAKIEATRQAWSQKLGLSEADWADAADWASHSQGERNAPSLYPRDTKAAWGAWGAVDQYAGILNSTMGDSARVTDHHYLTDALGPRLTEAGRLAYIEKCLGGNATPVDWAICEPDIAALDGKKLAEDLRADKTADGYRRMVVRIAYFKLLPQLAEHATKVKALKAKDGAYAQMFALAETARKDFAKVSPAHLELITSMDDARVTGSRKASAGCRERTWDAWKGVIGAIPAKQFTGMRTDDAAPRFLEQALAPVVGSPSGYLVSLSVFLCASLEGEPDYLERTLAGLLARWPGFRGPRNAGHTAILTAGLTLDDRDARLDYPDITRPWIGASGSSSGGGQGEIAKLTTKGDTAVIELAKVTFTQEECVKGHQTNRVRQIRSDGVIIYEYKCTQTRKATYSEPPAPPQTVKARYAAGLKKGMAVQVTEDVVVVAYPKGKSVPAVVAGVPVK
jgi:hypothetical protein